MMVSGCLTYNYSIFLFTVFVDDTVLVTKSTEELQTLLDLAEA